MIAPIDVIAARSRIGRYLRKTPLVLSPGLTETLGRPVYLKLENQQETGSFKPRGALNFVLQLAPEQRARGLVTASAGNHGQGVALAARLSGVPATVCVPAGTPQTKQGAIRHLGARLELVPGGYNAAHQRALDLAETQGLVYVPAFEHDQIIAGQGTVALEIFDQLPDVQTIVVPVGGGGLCSGIGVVARGLAPGARVVGVQSDLTPAMYNSLQAGHVVPVAEPPTLCEGLAGDIDAVTLVYAQQVLHGLELVPEAAVGPAIRWLVEQHRQIAEGSGAVGVAAILDAAARQRVFGAGGAGAGSGPVVVVVSGGNIDAGLLARLLA